MEIILLFFLEVVYAIIFWRYESAKDQAAIEAVIATARNVSTKIVGIVGMFEIGGEIMIRFTRLMQEAIAQLCKAEGKVEGKAEKLKAKLRFTKLGMPIGSGDGRQQRKKAITF